MDISGKVVVVTGGAQGLGLAASQMFVRGGAKVAIMDIQEDAIQVARAELGDDVLGVVTNVADEASVVAAFDKVVEHFGALDIAILNAGILRDGLLVKVDRETGKVVRKMSKEQWQSVIDVNLTGIFLTGREAAARMIDTGRKGVMVLMSSIARHGNIGQSNYSAAKSGVFTLAVVWGRELARHRIRVASISPGLIGTPMALKDMRQDMLEKLKGRIPVGRLGEPEEIAHTIKFIVENDLITAQNIEPSGGMVL